MNDGTAPLAGLRRVVSLGEAMLELSHIEAGLLQRGFGGDTFNTAVYLARATAGTGIDVCYATRIGDDVFSAELLRVAEAEALSTTAMVQHPGTLGAYIVRTDADGERSFTYYRGESPVRRMLRGRSEQELKQVLAGDPVVHLSGITLSVLAVPARARLLGLLAGVRRRGGLVSFDTNYRPRGWSSSAVARRWVSRALRLADVSLPTFDDEQLLFGDASPEATLTRHRAAGVRETVVKLGADGCIVGAGLERVPARVVDPVVDTTAAGDAFDAGYLAGRLAGRCPVDAARSGHRLAGHVVQHRGALVPAVASATEHPGGD